MGRPRQRHQVERRIHFYRVQVRQEDNDAHIPFDPRKVLEHIDSLPWDDQGRYMVDAEDNAQCCWVDRTRAPQRLRFAISRRSGLPLLERDGQVRPLRISLDTGLAELVHVVFFPNNIVGSEFNFYGPRVPTLRYYLEEKAPGICPPVTFEALLRQDVRDQLRRLSQVRVFTLKVRASYIETLRAANEDIGSALDVAAKAAEAEEVEIVLKPAAYRRRWLSDRMLGFVRTLAGRSDLREYAGILRVSGFDRQLGHMVKIDVLSDYLIASKRIVRQGGRSRALEPESAYRAIEEAHAELEADLHEAAGVA